MFGLGVGEIAVVLVLALLFIGPKKLPELAKGLGKGIREFQKAKDEIIDQVKNPAVEENTSTAEVADNAPQQTAEEKIAEAIKPEVVAVEGVIARGTTVAESEDKES